MHYRPLAKKVTPEDIHKWVTEARKILENGDEGMHDALDIFVVPSDPEDKEVDIIRVAAAFRSLLAHVEHFDALFHDLFDCRM